MIPFRGMVGTRVVVRKSFGLLRGYAENIAGKWESRHLYVKV
jgi:hypothetical protein